MRGRHISMTTSLSQVPLCNRYEALRVELNNDEDNGPSRLEVLPRLSQPTPYIKTTSTKKKKTGYCHRRLFGDEEKAQHTNQTHFSGKPSASLGPGLKMLQENFLP